MTITKDKEQLLDDLYNSVSETIRYFKGMLEQIANDKYEIAAMAGDIDFLQNNEILGILEELHSFENEAITQELPIVPRTEPVDV